MSELESQIQALDFLRNTDCRAVVFDMDGVLADTEEFHLEAWGRLVEAHGLEDGEQGLSEEMLELIRSTFGQANDTIIPLLWEKAGRSPGDALAALSLEKEQCYRNCARGRVRPMPGIEDFLGLLKKENIPAAIGTSGPEENVSFILEEFNWRNVFHSLVHRSRFKKGKPAPDCFLVAAEELGQPPDKTIVFEDSVHGLMAANSGGFTAAAIASTHEPAELTQYTGWVFRDFRSLSC